MKTPEERLDEIEKKEEEKKELVTYCCYWFVGTLAFLFLVITAVSCVQVADYLKQILELLKQ